VVTLSWQTFVLWSRFYRGSPTRPSTCGARRVDARVTFIGAGWMHMRRGEVHHLSKTVVVTVSRFQDPPRARLIIKCP
jgi:hypothetical protein